MTVDLLLHPLNTASQAFWLFQKLKDDLGAEITYLRCLVEGTLVTISLREPVNLIDFLDGVSEIAEAWEEIVNGQRRVMVSLKPS